MDSKLFWCVGVSVHTQLHRGGLPRHTPLWAPWLPAQSPRQPESQGLVAPLPGSSSPDWASEAHLHVCREPVIHLVNLKPVLANHLRHSLYWRQFYLLGSRRCFQSLSWSVICSMLFLSMIYHLIYWLGGNTRPQVVKHQLHTGRCPTPRSMITWFSPSLACLFHLFSEPSLGRNRHQPPCPIHFNRTVSLL